MRPLRVQPTHALCQGCPQPFLLHLDPQAAGRTTKRGGLRAACADDARLSELHVEPCFRRDLARSKSNPQRTDYHPDRAQAPQAGTPL